MKYLIPSIDALRKLSAIEAADNGVLPVRISGNGRVLHVIAQKGMQGRINQYISKPRSDCRFVVDDWISAGEFSRALVSFYRLEKL